MALDDNIQDLTVDEIMATLTEAQAKFVLHLSVIAGHMPRYWLEKGVKIARDIKNV